MTTALLDNIPVEMRRADQWIVWKLEGKTDTFKGTKVPRQIRNPFLKASSTDPNTWGSFGEAVAISQLESLSGVGFVFTKNNGIVAIDLDNCIDETNKPVQYAKKILDIFNNKTYIELSHSKKGYHILCRGKVPSGRLKLIEIYDSGRYFAMTGECVNGCNSLGECQQEIDLLFKEFGENGSGSSTKIPNGVIKNYGTISDNYGLRVEDIGRPDNAIDRGNGKFQGAHPFHGSTTGHNFTIDTHAGLWYCFRDGHHTGGDALTLFAVRENIIRCEDAMPGCLDGKWPEVFEALKQCGFRDRSIKTPPPEKRNVDLEINLDGLNCTHFGNADRFLVRYKELVRYCPPFDWWYIWEPEEGRWQRDERMAVVELGKNVILKIYGEASKAPFEDRRKALASWAIRCETPGSITQMLEVARSHPEIVVMPDIFDHEHHLVNLKNGYYDLNEFKFQPHDKARFFSMVLPFKYDSSATCPLWLTFLDRIFRSNSEKDKIIDFLQRAIGYTLTGDTSERAIFLMHGLGANGKTVFIRVLEALFGEYGASVSSVSFTTAMATNVRNDLARLKGKRFVWASENSSDTVLDEENIKRWSGGDTVVCRFLFKEEFTYRPNFKIWWIFNHKPKIKDATDSIWDRINLIPCEERIPAEEQDKKLTEKISQELPGIFNWAIEGYKKVRAAGLQAPHAVKEATNEYRKSEDVLADFLAETFDENQQALGDVRMPFRRIWDLWTGWCNQNNEKIRTKTWLGRQLGDRFKKYHERDEKGYLGLKVKGV